MEEFIKRTLLVFKLTAWANKSGTLVPVTVLKIVIMTKTSLALILVSLAMGCVLVTAEDYVELNKDNFATEMKKYDLALVKFYAEWCGHCKRMAPAFASAATKLKSHKYPVQLVKVNCPDNDNLCSDLGVSGYPTLKIYRGGVLSQDYDGGREEDDIVAHMKGLAGPASSLLESESELKEALAGDESVFVAYVKSKNAALDVYMEAAGTIRQPFNFYHSIDAKVEKDHIKRFLPSKIQSKVEKPFVQLDLPATKTEIMDFVYDNWGGELSWQRGSANPKLIGLGDKVTVHFNLNYVMDPKGTNYVRNRLIKAINELRKDSIKSRFFMSSGIDNRQLLDSTYNVKFNKDSKPVVVIMSAKNEKFVMSDEFSYDNFKKFVKDFEAGKLEPYMKSEPVPKKQEAGEVVTVVAKNFNEIVMDETKDVMIEFYAPWCGHCKSLKPIYEEVAKRLRNEPSVVIAAMDATANDVDPSFKVSGFPTIYWVPKGKSPVLYDSERTADAFIRYIKANAEAGSAIKDEL